MPLTKRSFKPYCPVTVPGALYLLAAAVLLLLGRIRGELGSALAGLLILAYALFSLAACLAARPFWKRTQFRIEQLPHGRVSLTGTALPPLWIRFLCGARLHVHFHRLHSSRKVDGWSLDLPIGRVQTEHTPPSPDRGLFSSREKYLVLHDFASFFAFRLQAPAANAIERMLFPATPEPHAAGGVVSGKSGRVSGTSTFNRSDNLYETRTYLPGDDPRKINWKVYAHSGSLSIREGELLPPPAAELFCFFNTDCPDTSGKTTDQTFTSLINRAAAFLLEALENRMTIILVWSNPDDTIELLRVEPGINDTRKTITDALAIPALSSPVPDFTTITSRIPPKATILLFSLPGARILKSSGHRILWFTGPYPVQAEAHKPGTYLRKWLFVSNNFDSRGSVFRPIEFERFGTRLEQEGIHAHIL